MAPTNEDSSLWIDHSALELFEQLKVPGEPDLLVEVIESFLKTAPPRLKTMQEFIRNGDLAKAAQEAHALKSGSRTLGALKLGDILQKLEDLKKSTDTEVAQKLVAELEKAFAPSCQQLQQVLQAQKAKNE